MPRLHDILPPPSRPIEIPTAAEWRLAEAELGELPEDYKAFLAAYGTGTIDGFLWIWNPASSNTHLNLLHRVPEWLGTLRALAVTEPQTATFALFPDKGGLLPIASTDNGDIILWQTEGAPHEWTIVVNDARAPVFDRFPSGLTEFLLAILTRSVKTRVFPEDFPSPRPTFESPWA